jgi:hypothetical protein
MANTRRSVSREIGADDIRAYSSFSDFLELAVQEGKVKDLADLLDKRPDLLGGILFDWYSQGQIACVFAQRLARVADRTKWESLTIKGEVDANELEAFLKGAADKFEALQLVFPGPATAYQAVDLIKTLCQHPSWSCHEIDWMPDERGRSLQVGLRWHAEESDYHSWVLGIAPFGPMPFTRRFEGAPFIALVLRPSPPSSFAPTPREKNLNASHLAHMDDGLGSDVDKRERTNKATKTGKSLLLGPDLRSTARAKVTFALPLWCRDLLGDSLIPVRSSWFRAVIIQPFSTALRELRRRLSKGDR